MRLVLIILQFTLYTLDLTSLSLLFNVMTKDDYHHDIVKIDKKWKISRNFPYYHQKQLTVTLSLGENLSKTDMIFSLGDIFGTNIGFRSVTVKNDDPRNSLYITIFVVSKKLEYGSRVVQKSNYRKQQKVWRSRFEMVLSWQNWQNLLRQMLNSEYLTKNWIISTNTG